MHKAGLLLQEIGKRGPTLLIAALFLGIWLGSEASWLKMLLPLAAFFLTLGSFLAAGLSPREFNFSEPEGVFLGLAWVVVAVPCLAVSVLSGLNIDPYLKLGLILAFIAPPIGSAAALAAILRLKPQLALALSIAPTIIAPLTVPVFLSASGFSFVHGFTPLIVTLASIVGAAVFCTFAVLSNKARIRQVLPDATAASGISILGLILVGIIAASQARLAYSAQPAFFDTIGLAFALNLGSSAVGALTFWVWGQKEALTVGLVTGNRNVTLAWAMAGSALPSSTESFVIAAVVPILVFPLLIKSLLLLSRLRFEHPIRVRSVGLSLHFLGKNGPYILALSLVGGLLCGDSVVSNNAILATAALLITLGSFLAAAFTSEESSFKQPEGIVLALLWMTLALPCLAISILSRWSLDPGLKSGLLVMLLAPPIGSAAALAAVLGFRPKLAAILSIGPTLIAPFTLPAFLSISGIDLPSGIGPVVVVSAGIVGLAAILTLTAVKRRARTISVVPDATAAGGISILGLSTVGFLGSAHARAIYEAQPEFLDLIKLAFTMNFAACGLGAFVFWVWGKKEAFTVGLVTGNRNVTLAWAIAGTAMPPSAQLFVVAAVLPILLLPLLVKIMLRLTKIRLSGSSVLDKHKAAAATVLRGALIVRDFALDLWRMPKPFNR